MSNNDNILFKISFRYKKVFVDEVESEENLLINSDVDALSEEMEKV